MKALQIKVSDEDYWEYKEHATKTRMGIAEWVKFQLGVALERGPETPEGRAENKRIVQRMHTIKAQKVIDPIKAEERKEQKESHSIESIKEEQTEGAGVAEDLHIPEEHRGPVIIKSNTEALSAVEKAKERAELKRLTEAGKAMKERYGMK